MVINPPEENMFHICIRQYSLDKFDKTSFVGDTDWMMPFGRGAVFRDFLLRLLVLDIKIQINLVS